MTAAGRASLPDVLWQGLAPQVRRLLAAALAGGLVLTVAAAVWLAAVRPVALPALVLAFVGVGLLIQALGAGPNRLRVVQGQPGAPRPIGARSWYYGLSGALMVLALLEIGIGFVALAQSGPLRVLIVVGAAVSAFTAVLGALSTANLTKYTDAAGSGRQAPPTGKNGRKGGGRGPSGAKGVGGGRRPSAGRRKRRR